MNLSELRSLVFRRDGKRATDGAICEWGTLDVSKHLLYLILLPAMGPLLYYCLAIFSSWDYFKRVKKLTATEPGKLLPISILKPICGLDRELYENFASMCRLDYPKYEIIFGVGETDDPAIPLVARLQREFPERSIRLILGIEQLGAFRKTNTLCRLVREAKYDLLVMNDSDVRVEKSYLRDVMENCGIIFSCLSVATANAGVGSGRLGPARFCRKKQSVACSGTRCAQSVSVRRELFLQQSGVAGGTLSRLR